MARLKKGELDALANPSHAREHVMLLRLLEAGKTFYQDPKNRQAFEAWLKKEEANNNVANHINT